MGRVPDLQGFGAGDALRRWERRGWRWRGASGGEAGSPRRADVLLRVGEPHRRRGGAQEGQSHVGTSWKEPGAGGEGGEGDVLFTAWTPKIGQASRHRGGDVPIPVSLCRKDQDGFSPLFPKNPIFMPHSWGFTMSLDPPGAKRDGKLWARGTPVPSSQGENHSSTGRTEKLLVLPGFSFF